VKYFYELAAGEQFTLGGVRCRKLSARSYEVLRDGHQVPVGNGRFKVAA